MYHSGVALVAELMQHCQACRSCPAAGKGPVEGLSGCARCSHLALKCGEDRAVRD